MKDIYSVLFDNIIAGKYPVNTRLKEEILAAEFKISRTPIRTVLQQLEKDGLVQISPNKGAKVLAFRADEIEEIYEIRKYLELLALEISVPVLSMRILLEFKRKFNNAYEEEDSQILADLDAEFHNYIIKSTGKKRLVKMLNQLFRLIQRFRSLGYMKKDTKETTIKEHIEIIDALCLRDIVQAKELMTQHLEQSKMVALSQLFK